MIRRHALAGSSPSSLRSRNLRAILLALLRHEHISRVRLAELTGLSTTAITKLVAQLIQQGVVAEEGTAAPGRRAGAGRPRKALQLVPSAHHALGVHIGIGNLRVALTDLRAHPLSYHTAHFPLHRPAEAVVDDIAGLLHRALTDGGVPLNSVVSVGVGASGLVDPVTGVNLVAPQLGWRSAPLRQWLAQRIDCPICVDNNVRAMALGESLFGAGQDAHAMAFVYARAGVGAGFVVDDRLFRGSGAGAGEIGHTTIIADNGQPCRCGNTGCLETLVSEPAILCLAEQIAREDPTGCLAAHLRQAEDSPLEGVFAAARAGDPATCAMLQERARYMGIALANLVNVLNPELIVLGGIFEQGQDVLLAPIEAVMRQRAFANLGQRVRVQPASFGRQAGVIGAAALALNAFFYRQGEI